MLGARKRSRPNAGGPRDKARIARAISYRTQQRWPRAQYGTTYHQRGTPENLAFFGPTYKTANAMQRAERKRLGYTGKGAYRGRGGFWDDVWGGVKSVASDAWGALGQPILGRAAKMITGSGRYMRGQGAYNEPIHTNDMVISGPGHAPSVPVFSEKGDAAEVTISHKEYIRDVVGYDTATTPKGFRIDTIQLNPGLDSIFPWLAQLAANYEEYTMHQCIVSYRSTVADFAANNGQVGTITIATKYNNLSDAYADIRSMMESDSSSSAKTSEHQQHGIECDPRKLSMAGTGKYVRTSAPQVGADVNDYDHCQTSIAVSGLPAAYSNQVLGQLWVSYTVTLRKPRFWTSKGNSIDTDFYYKLNGTCGAPAGTGSGLINDPTLLSGQQNSNITKLYGRGCSIPGLTAGTVTLVPARGVVPGTTLGSNSEYAIAILVDNSYSGDIEITIACNLVTGAAYEGNNSLNAWGAGNVMPIYDIYNSVSAAGTKWRGGQSLPFNQSAAQATGFGETLTGTFHFRVNPSSLGVPNCVFITNQGAPSSTSAILDTQIRIRLYNTTLSYKQSGVNDTLILQNSLSQLIPLAS